MISDRARIFVHLALDAGRKIMEIYATDFSFQTKSDLSPVTLADQQAETIITRGLKRHWPQIPIVAEEASAAGNIPKIQDLFFLVDPLDGTKEFLSRNGEFTVNIALIENTVPVLGVVYAPALDQIFLGELGHGAYQATTELVWRKANVRTMPQDGATVLASRSHRDAATDDYLATVKVKTITSAGSSLKFCKVATGEADLYPRFGRTMEWDTAAGHAVLLSAGGKVCTIDGKALSYGKVERGFDNPAFIASS